MYDILFRRAEIDDVDPLATLYSKIYSGGYSRSEYKKTNKLATLLENENYICSVALDGKEIIGSSAIILHGWNKSFEFGRTVVNRDYLKKGIAKKLCEQVRDRVVKNGFEFGWGTVRNDAIYKISLRDGMSMVGYTTRYKPHNTREAQVVCEMGVSPKRIIPPKNRFYDLEMVRKIEESINMPGEVGDYPDTVIVNSGKEKSDKISISFNPEDSSAKIIEFPKEMPQHFLVTLLADKIDEIFYFNRFGFKVTAFLPAWYYLDGKRYDCVLMENTDLEPGSNDEVIDGLVKDFVKGFEPINK